MSKFFKQVLVVISGSIVLALGFQNCSKSFEVEDTNLSHTQTLEHDHDHAVEAGGKKSGTSTESLTGAYYGYCAEVTGQGVEYTPRYNIPVNRNGHNENHPNSDCRVKLDYIDQAVAIEISRWTSAFPGHATINEQSIVNYLRATPINLNYSQNYSVAYNNGTSINILVTQQNAYSPASRVFCNNNTDPTSKTLIHEMDHILAKKFGFSYANSVGPGHQAGGTWDGYNINGTIISPAFNPQPAYAAYCLDPVVAPSIVTLTGRVLDKYGRGISSVYVTIVNANTGETMRWLTNTFGYYKFEGLSTQTQYTITATNRRYTFAPVTFDLTDNIQSLNITAQ